MEPERLQRNGLVIENLGYNKYRIKVDGSGRVTDRNRQYLRQFSPVTSPLPGPHPGPSYVHKPVVEPQHQPVIEPEYQPVEAPQQQPQIIPDMIPETPAPSTPRQVVVPQPDSPTTPGSPSFVTPPTTPAAPAPVEPPRRSTRISRPPDRFNYDKFGSPSS